MAYDAGFMKVYDDKGNPVPFESSIKNQQSTKNTNYLPIVHPMKFHLTRLHLTLHALSQIENLVQFKLIEVMNNNEVLQATVFCLDSVQPTIVTSKFSSMIPIIPSNSAPETVTFVDHTDTL